MTHGKLFSGRYTPGQGETCEGEAYSFHRWPAHPRNAVDLGRNRRKDRPMILFHGSLQIVREPHILVPNRTLDYGAGFYSTTSEQQAREWILRKLSGEVSE